VANELDLWGPFVPIKAKKNPEYKWSKKFGLHTYRDEKHNYCSVWYTDYELLRFNPQLKLWLYCGWVRPVLGINIPPQSTWLWDTTWNESSTSDFVNATLAGASLLKFVRSKVA
jgi:hypothetical protein